jgi:MraZ protein
MKSFLSKFSFKVDTKGRVSIPAEYRSTLKELGSTGLFAFETLQQRSIRCVTSLLVDQITAGTAPDSVFSPGAPSLALLALADMVPLVPDGDGRVILPRHLLDHAGITETALFAGQGTHFEIWEPGAFEAHRADLRRQLMTETKR